MMDQPSLIVEEVNDAAELARFRAQHERFFRNAAWLDLHWNDVTPAAFGKFIAVAGEEAFIADSSREAWAWARDRHPEDPGPLVEYVLPPRGPRIYANRR
jgi:hypothetical protein